MDVQDAIASNLTCVGSSLHLEGFREGDVTSASR